ncbi:MAG: hypothetical protein CMJ83_15415 [Planctomycetes bacterium]|nr:hypothetical protein [Planctomycetota bacterium]
MKRADVGLSALLLLSGLVSAAPQDRELALTPPMGWNSWNAFETDIDEKKIRAISRTSASVTGPTSAFASGGIRSRSREVSPCAISERERSSGSSRMASRPRASSSTNTG